MGTLRLFLALSVVVGHTKPIFGYQMLPSAWAVSSFFVISGFYMALVLDSNYRNRLSLFYSNRFLRLWPAYIIVFFSTAALVVLSQSFGHLPDKSKLPSEYWLHFLGRPSSLSAFELLLVTIPNLTMIGADLMYQFYRNASEWTYFFDIFRPGLSELPPGSEKFSGYLLVTPIWSIGSEFWFYVLAPFLTRFKTVTLIATATGSVGLRELMHHLWPWSYYFFFPALLCLFIFGILAYRFWRSGFFQNLPMGNAVAYFVGLSSLALLFFREFVPGFRNYEFMSLGVLIFGLPFLFKLSAGLQWDRWIGTLSFPVYLSHVPVMVLIKNVIGWESSALIAGVTIGVSIALVLYVEEPIERFRRARVRA